MPEVSNAAMQAFVSAQKANARRRYDRKVSMDLSRQNSQQLFKRDPNRDWSAFVSHMRTLLAA